MTALLLEDDTALLLEDGGRSLLEIDDPAPAEPSSSGGLATSNFRAKHHKTTGLATADSTLTGHAVATFDNTLTFLL